MFKKKECNNCKRKLSDDYDFCPYCGNPVNESRKKDWGMLGRDDSIPSNFNEFPKGFNAMFNFLAKNLAKQFSDAEKVSDNPDQAVKRSGIKIDISTSGNNAPKIRIGRIGEPQKEKKKILLPVFSKEKLGEFLNTPRKEPETNVRRFSKRIIYEIELPDVKSLGDISIMKLENSIEIRAIAKGMSYLKIIPINFPITDYGFSEGRLTIELKS